METMKYRARVIRGRGEGRKLGFPTLNLEIPPGFAEAEKQGVYAGRVWLEDDAPRPAAFHHGPAPTFGIETPSLEAYVLDADISTAPKELSFELLKYLREVRNFEGPEALAAQIAKDVEDTREAYN